MIYKPTIGLEIHVELKTETKMFCGCLNVSLRETADKRGQSAEQRGNVEIMPNTNICPICLAHPGTLPVANKKAVEAVLKLGMALNGKIPNSSKFDRKNYFYPDLPKGYQISQYDKPFVLGGALEIKNQKSKIKIKLTRVHLEEDTARLIHETGNMKHETQKNASSFKLQASSFVDFNRAGVPLMELVTEPDVKTGEEAVAFARELQLILRYLGISEANMEKGQMRVEANISLARIDTDLTQTNTENSQHKSVLSQYKSVILGTKVEVKNLNSFRAVKDAIDYEIKRQEEVLEKGEKVRHETRGWDENKKITVSQRGKEEAHDYRYFPEPDLPPMDISKFDLDKLKAEITELPAQKRERFIKEYGLNLEQAEIFVENRDLSDYFEASASELIAELRGTDAEQRGQKAIDVLFNYLTSDIMGLTNELKIGIKELNITPENFSDLIVLIVNGEISSRVAKDLIREMHINGNDPRQIIEEKGLGQISDEEEIKKIIQQVIEENPSAVEDYKKGKQSIIQFLIGKAMAKLKGRGKPEIIEKLLKETLTKIK